MNTDYDHCYSALELPRHADIVLARTQYKRLTQRWHPDRHSGQDATIAAEKFRHVRDAFQALKAFHHSNERLPFEPRQIDEQEFSEAHEALTRREHTLTRQRKRRKTRRTPVNRLSYLLGFLIIAFLIYSSTTKKGDYVGGDIFDPPSQAGAVQQGASSDGTRRAPLFSGQNSSTSVGEALNRELFGR